MKFEFSCFTLIWATASGFLLPGLSKSDEKVSKASCEFTLNLLKNVETKYNSSNIVFSPASINILLSIVQQGANGNTGFELEKVLGLTAEESKGGYKKLLGLTKEKNVTFEWGNRCYIKPGFKLNEEYVKVVQNSFHVGVEELDFGVPSSQDSADKMNGWIKEVTHGQISDLVEASAISVETIMVMINAIFFKGNWAKPYKKGKTTLDKFEINSKESVQTLFMSQRDKYYSNKDNFLGAKWVQQTFQNERFSMIFVLPTKKHQLTQLLAKMTSEDLYNIFNNLEVSHVKLRIPKFKIKEKVSLVQTLNDLGLKDIFTSSSDLRGIAAEGSGLAVSDIIHEATVEIDEKGGSGSAATVVQFLRSRTPTMTFVADQPFLFFLIDETTKIPLFAGKVFNPTT